MTNQEAARILTRINKELREHPDNLKEISDAIDAGIKALRDLEDAKDLLNEIANGLEVGAGRLLITIQGF